MSVGALYSRIMAALIDPADPAGERPIKLRADAIGRLQVVTAAGAPVQVEGTEADGAVGTANPIQIAGRDQTGNVSIPHTQVDGVAFGDRGWGLFLEYQAVKGAVADGDAVPGQSDAYGNLESAAYSRAVGADQGLEIAPYVYDVQNGTARASAALPAAGAYDAAPTEIPCAGLRYCILVGNYTRAAAGGSCAIRLQKCVTIGGTDYWYDAIIQNPVAFAAGADSQINIQRARPYVYQATGAALEEFGIEIDNLRCDKIRFPSAELGAVANPGTLFLGYKLSN